MAAYTSPWPSQDINDALNQWLDSEAGALVGWALRAVGSLHYLADVDAAVFTNLERPTMGHPEQAVDTGHVRWACVSAITALDLCAGAIWRLSKAEAGTKRPPDATGASLRWLDPSEKGTAKRRGRVSAARLAWVDRVTADLEYSIVLTARNPLTHARTTQRNYSGNVPATPHAYRSDYHLRTRQGKGLEVSSRDLIEKAVSLATTHVESFIQDVVLVP